MQLVSTVSAQGASWGVLNGDTVVDHRTIDPTLPDTLAGFIARCATQSGLQADVATKAAGLSGLPFRPRMTARPAFRNPARSSAWASTMWTMPRKAATPWPTIPRCSCAAARRCWPMAHR